MFLTARALFVLLTLSLSINVKAQSVPSSEEPTIGPETGLEIPRFVSIGVDEARMRTQPSRDHSIRFIYLRVGLPMKVLEESGEWRFVEDHEGEQGWMHRSVLSGDRGFRIMTPTAALYTRADISSPVRAEMEAGVVGELLTCTGNGWCRARVESSEGRQTGWLRSSAIWGVLPGEIF